MRALAVAAIEHVADQQMAEVQAASKRHDARDVLEVVDDLVARPTFLAGLELWMAARTDPELRAALRPGARRTAAQLRQVFTDALAIPDDRADLFVDGLLSLMRGVALGGVLRRRGGSGHRAVLEAWVHAMRSESQ